MRTDLSFDPNYEISLADEIPGISGKVEQFYYPGASTSGIAGISGGIWVRIIPRNKSPWMGFFAGQYQSPPAISAIASSPNPLLFCVVSFGTGYIVNAEDPRDWMKVVCFPILDLRSIPSTQLLLFSDFTKIVAYGPHGKAWHTQDVCWDKLTIQEVTTERVLGSGWNAPKSREMDFEVDLKTGRILRGGAV
jgi:hypothetical protein